ncbi:TraB/GumN family protein, partial [Rhizorhabdus sp.]|uniref:TraB/GumN family protein n=1 Tax=Rhizorhabdus sp. TaxID=1968843 RepID=UPI0019A58465
QRPARASSSSAAVPVSLVTGIAALLLLALAGRWWRGGRGAVIDLRHVIKGAPFDNGAPSTLLADLTKKVEALETASEQLGLFASLPEADQREMLASFADGSGEARKDYARLLRAWTTGDQASIARAFNEDEDLTPHLRDVLLKKRNENWARWLKTRLDVPGTVFVAVGAGHLAGPLSVQTMLKADGITVSRVWPPRKRRPAGAVRRTAARSAR